MAALKAYKAALAQGVTSDEAVAMAVVRLRAIEPGASESELRHWLAHRLAAERIEQRRKKAPPDEPA
jgi:hypothetical protein